jgi:hypothetical protein
VSVADHEGQRSQDPGVAHDPPSAEVVRSEQRQHAGHSQVLPMGRTEQADKWLGGRQGLQTATVSTAADGSVGDGDELQSPYSRLRSA